MTAPWIVISVGWASFIVGVILLAAGQHILGWQVLGFGGLLFAATILFVVIAVRRVR